MKTTLNILIGFIFLLSSCNNLTTDARKSYVESKSTFFELRNGDWLTNKWIRKPENLLTIHETFKKFGYWNLITNELLDDSPLLIQGIYINRSGSHLLDSLELTYSQTDIKEKYYREFWLRRKLEKNDSIVYVIISEINQTLKKQNGKDFMPQNSNLNLVNGTLLSLLQIEFCDSLTEKIATQDFTTLKRLGFHQSAYNMLFEIYKYQDFDWNKGSLEKTLSKSDQFFSPWFQDDTP